MAARHTVTVTQWAGPHPGPGRGRPRSLRSFAARLSVQYMQPASETRKLSDSEQVCMYCLPSLGARLSGSAGGPGHSV